MWLKSIFSHFSFQYNRSIYEQKNGATMGSPVSAVIANLYMKSFEEQAINTSSYDNAKA